MKKLLLSIFSAIALPAAFAQNANIQFINNSPDSLFTGLDVYINNALRFDNILFRQATAYTNIPFGIPVTIGFAPDNSTSAMDTFYSATYTFGAGTNNILVANGMENTARHNPATPFSVRAYPNAKQVAANPANTDILFANGSTDAQPIDIRSGVSVIDNNLRFESYSPAYRSFPSSSVVTFRVTNETGNKTHGTYNLPLIPFAGQTGVVLASGFLNPAQNRQGPGFAMLYVSPMGMVMQLSDAPAEDICRVQLLHNSADNKLSTVDVYIDDSLAINNMAYQTGTPFVDMFANQNVVIGIAPATSNSVLDTFYSKEMNFGTASTNVAVINGIESATGYSPAPPLDIDVYNMAREASTNPNKVDMLLFHGSTDAPVVDLEASSGTTLANDLSYGNFSSGYLSLDPVTQVVNMTDASGTIILKSYNAMLMGLNGIAGTVLASGFLTPAANSNGEMFGLFAVTDEGGSFIPIPEIPVSVKDVATASVVRVYPNPSADRIYIKGNFGAGATGAILDAAGRTVKSIEDLNRMVDVSSLQTGLYLIRVQDGGNVYTRKFNKQ